MGSSAKIGKNFIGGSQGKKRTFLGSKHMSQGISSFCSAGGQGSELNNNLLSSL